LESSIGVDREDAGGGVVDDAAAGMLLVLAIDDGGRQNAPFEPSDAQSLPRLSDVVVAVQMSQSRTVGFGATERSCIDYEHTLWG
jgi:hypothetical protein